MTSFKKAHSKPVTRKGRVFTIALAPLLAVMLMPAERLDKAKDPWIERFENFSGEELRDTNRIYSILRSHNTQLSDRVLWNAAETILRESVKYSLDPMLVMAVIKVESGFQHMTVSPDGARGLMQIRPTLAHALAEKFDIGFQARAGTLLSEPLDDPVFNITLGVSYLGELKRIFKETNLALAAYQRGPTEIKKRLIGEQEVPREYAAKVLSAYQRMQENESR